MTTPTDEEIRRGLERHEFDVHYQPVVALADHRIVAVEALVRWNHPERGLLAPDAFIGLAEGSELIREIGATVLEQACRQAAAWRRAGFDITVAVNLSTQELSDDRLADRVTSVLAAAGLPASALSLEVTETALVEDVRQARTMLERLVDSGVGVTIDDFGTGWASLTYLKEFPVHTLKIDRSFVEGLGVDAHNAVIARSVLSLGDELRKFVVAEGIETDEQKQALQAFGCELGQGYLFGRPTSADAFPIERASRIGAPCPPSSRTGSRLPVGPSIAAPAHVCEPSGGTVTTLLRALLHIGSAADAVDALHRAVRALGGTVIGADDATEEVLAIDVSLGEGPKLFVAVEPLSIARMHLERTLPQLVDDAEHAIALLHSISLVHADAQAGSSEPRILFIP